MDTSYECAYKLINVIKILDGVNFDVIILGRYNKICTVDLYTKLDHQIM